MILNYCTSRRRMITLSLIFIAFYSAQIFILHQHFITIPIRFTPNLSIYGPFPFKIDSYLFEMYFNHYLFNNYALTKHWTQSKSSRKAFNTIPVGHIGISIHASGQHSHDIGGSTASTGNGKSFNIMPPSQTMNFLILSE